MGKNNEIFFNVLNSVYEDRVRTMIAHTKTLIELTIFIKLPLAVINAELNLIA